MKAYYDRNDYSALVRSNLPAALVPDRSLRFDSAEDASVFFARELDYVKAKAYDKEYPQFTALQIFPHTSEVDPGANTFTYHIYDKTGMAKVISNYATDLPRADVVGEEQIAHVKSLGDSYGYSIQEMRASRYANKNLDARKAESARFQIDSLTNRIAWMGDEKNKLIGVLSPNNDIPIFVPAVGASGKTEWESKTAEEIMKDINGFMKQVAFNTKNVERPDSLALPAHTFIDIATRQIPNTGYTILKFIMENAPYLKNIHEAAELQSDAVETNPFASKTEGNGKNVGFFYTKDPEKLCLEDPMPFTQHPVQPKGLEMEVPCESRFAGAIIYFPLSALIAVGI